MPRGTGPLCHAAQTDPPSGARLRHDRDTVSGREIGRTTMIDMNRAAGTGRYRTLSEDELNVVAGGDAKAAAPAPKQSSGGLFEIEDYSFDIEQVVRT